jgi:hypothetical protein
MSARLLCSMILVGTVATCSCHSGSRHESAAYGDGGDGGDGDGGPEISCPVSDSGRFEETPTGACVGAGSCAIELDNSCRPGISVVPSTAPVFECQCVSNQWQCVVKSGGLGIITCSDAGAPNQG